MRTTTAVAASARTMLATTKRSHSNRNGESVWNPCATLDGVRFGHTLMGQPKIFRPSHNFYIFSPTCRRRRQRQRWRRREEKKENNERSGTTLSTRWIYVHFIHTSLPNTTVLCVVCIVWRARAKHWMINRRMLGRIFARRWNATYKVNMLCWSGVAYACDDADYIIIIWVRTNV